MANRSHYTASSSCIRPESIAPVRYHNRIADDFVVSYNWQKGTIVGPSWKIPFIGPFLESMNPKFDEYKAKWASGELSCVSVFHK